MSDELREAAQGALAARLPSRYLEQHAILPLTLTPGGEVIVAAGKALDPTTTDELARVFERRVKLVSASADDIHAAIVGARGAESAAETPPTGPDESLGDLRALANDAPVVQLVNATLAEALRTGASDVHLESTRDGLRVRLRLDGVLRDVATYTRTYQAGALSRVKLLAGLDIAERRLPQDGRARVRLGAREVDVRVSTLPAIHGESVVLRLLDHAQGARDLASLGMPAAIERALSAVLHRSTGLILATGPTGSGKTTTLYAALTRLNSASVKIVTVEDPVEYQLPGVTQIPVNRKAGLSFPNVLRSILRHDPDIIMVGEMRDHETAEVAVQAALTGHLVLSTLHTNDAPSGVTRLVDMGIEPYLVSATLQAILAQRLVRVLCTSCSRLATKEELAAARHVSGLGGGARVPVGCDACSQSGYRGRTGLYELFVPSDAARERIAAQPSLDALRLMARDGGMTTLTEAGWELVRAGRTSVEEVLRVTREDGAA
jgi:type II secretory ATPase GspE/PulE/Tfp pilus assembly ATPase PilB-like protein